jgi:hypothetical protein
MIRGDLPGFSTLKAPRHIFLQIKVDNAVDFM